MGVVGLFSFLRYKYKSAFSPLKPKLTYIYIDANAILHTIANITKDPIKMADTLLETAYDFGKQYKCGVGIYFDGPAVMAKIKQQRLRRFELEPLIDNYSSGFISPGTELMEKVHQRIEKKIEEYNKYVNEYSSYKVPHEGEHKIMDDIRGLRDVEEKDDVVAILGKDADLILLLMGINEQQGTKTYVIRHEDSFTDFWYKPTDPLVHIDCEQLRNLISPNKSIWNFIISSFLLGNDFIPPIPDLTPVKNILPIMIENMSDELYKNGKINYNALKDYMRLLFSKIKSNLEWLETESKYMPLSVFSEMYYQIIHPFPVNYQSLVNEWYKIVEWNFSYYHNGPDSISFSYQYPTLFSPSLYTLTQYNHDERLLERVYKKDKPLSPEQALIAIIPIWLRKDIVKYDKDLSHLKPYFPFSFRKTPYTEYPLIPNIPYNELINL